MINSTFEKKLYNNSQYFNINLAKKMSDVNMPAVATPTSGSRASTRAYISRRCTKPCPAAAKTVQPEGIRQLSGWSVNIVVTMFDFVVSQKQLPYMGCSHRSTVSLQSGRATTEAVEGRNDRGGLFACRA